MATQSQVTPTAGGNYDTPVGVGGAINNTTGAAIPTAAAANYYASTGQNQPPVIPASTLSATASPATAPTTPQSTALQALAGHIQASQDAFTESLDQNAQSTETAKNSSLDALISGLKGQTGQAAATDAAYAGGVDPLQKELAGINNQITAEQVSSRHAAEALAANPGGLSTDALNSRIADINRQSLSKQADLAVIQMAKQGQYDSAKAIADRAVAVQMEQQKQNIDALQLAYQDNKDLFTTAEQRQFTTAQADRNRALDDQTYQAHAKFDQLIKQHDPLYQAQLAKAGLDLRQGRIDQGLDPQTGKSVQGGAGALNVPAGLQPYYKTSYDGTPYVDLSTLTPVQKQAMAVLATRSGIKPILDTNDASKVNAIAVTKSNLNDIMNAFNAVPVEKQGLGGGPQGITNAIKGFFGNADIRAYQNYRTSAINTLQALAGGAGSGFRINQSEINAAVKDIPVLTGPGADTPAQAAAKIANLNGQIDKWQNQLLGTGNQASIDQANGGSTFNGIQLPH